MPRAGNDLLIRRAQASDVDAIKDCVSAAYQQCIARIGKSPGPMVDDCECACLHAKVETDEIEFWFTTEENMSSKKVLLIGFDPAVVDFSKWPGLTAEKLLAALEGDRAILAEAGYDARLCFVDLGDTAESTVQQALSETAFDCVLIGAGVRTSEEHFLLFEKLVNVVHRHAPAAKLCFNTGPSDTAQAVQRWV